MSDYGTGNSAAGDLFLARARIRELEAQLEEAHGDLTKARDAWEMRGVGHGFVALSEHDGSAQKMRDALRGPELRALKTVTPPTE